MIHKFIFTFSPPSPSTPGRGGGKKPFGWLEIGLTELIVMGDMVVQSRDVWGYGGVLEFCS